MLKFGISPPQQNEHKIKLRPEYFSNTPKLEKSVKDEEMDIRKKVFSVWKEIYEWGFEDYDRLIEFYEKFYGAGCVVCVFKCDIKLVFEKNRFKFAKFSQNQLWLAKWIPICSNKIAKMVPQIKFKSSNGFQSKLNLKVVPTNKIKACIFFNFL